MSLAYRNMQHTIGLRELESSPLDDAGNNRQPSYYWHVEHRPKRSWKFLTDFWGSEAAMAEFWMKYFGTKPNYRLICFDITSPADLAKVEAEPRAQIATDLSEYLKG